MQTGILKVGRSVFLGLLAAALVATGVTSSATAATTDGLTTWWHDNGDANATSAVADDKVRRSTFYDVRVATAATPTALQDSFTYMSIPRSGKGKVGYTEEDGAEFADSADLSMSWSSFEYATDVWVNVTLKSRQTLSSVDQVQIRPSSYNFEKQLVNSTTVRVKVPYASTGYRFSVEFQPQLYTAYNDLAGASGNLTTNAGGNRAIHTEPRNSVMIFAEPTLTGAEKDRLIPTSASGSIHYPRPGRISNLNTVTEDIIYFGPGTYYMGSNYHAVLPANVKWVYLAPGAYVKGAFRFFHDNHGLYKVTGHGVLSGEQYVYEADTNDNYQHLGSASNCHASCVKMLQFQSSNAEQYLDLQGVTIADPPYHSFVVYGNESTFHMRVDNYKQVGSWYWQTDGIELYRGSTMKNTFFHANDDVLKLYHSDVRIDNTVIWKNENGPVIQWGWTPRNIDGVTVNNTTVIHNKMSWEDVKYNTCILNSSAHWENLESTKMADPNTTIKNISFDNITVEGMTNCAIRVYALSSTENIHIKNLKIGGWNGLDASSQISLLKRHTNAAGQKVTIGNETTQSRGIKLENYTVGGETINKAGTNWNATSLGRLGFDNDTWDSWNAWGSGTGTGTGTTTPPPPPAGTASSGRLVNAASSKCIDRAGAGTTNGTAIQQWGCANVASMTWSLSGTELQSGGKCLDVVGGATANGTKAHLWACGGYPSQQWVQQQNGSIKNTASGRCLDIEGGSLQDGARLHLWDCGTWASQKWTFQ